MSNNIKNGLIYIQKQISLFVRMSIFHFVPVCWNGLLGKNNGGL